MVTFADGKLRHRKGVPQLLATYTDRYWDMLWTGAAKNEEARALLECWEAVKREGAKVL